MEVIDIPGYLIEEKIEIALSFLVPKQLKEHGLPSSALRFEDESLRKIIHIYTQEAGVRELQRKIAQICRKVAVEWVDKKTSQKKNLVIGLKDLSHYLGVPEFVREKIAANAVGISTGLAWTDHGGETLAIEVTTMPGQGKVLLTGKLGSVMQESAQTALSMVKSRALKLGIRHTKFDKTDIHVHIPEGAVPKDGPSAGVTMATALASVYTHTPVRTDTAMTGEITLTGLVLPIGGLKEKVLAARRAGIHRVIAPKGNEKDLQDFSEAVRKETEFVFASRIEQVLAAAFPQAAEEIETLQAG